MVVVMKNYFKLVLILSMFFLFNNVGHAYNIGGAYAHLVSCEWGQYGYEYGYIGTYEVNGQYYKVFFGSNYCEYWMKNSHFI